MVNGWGVSEANKGDEHIFGSGDPNGWSCSFIQLYPEMGGKKPNGNDHGEYDVQKHGFTRIHQNYVHSNYEFKHVYCRSTSIRQL